MLTIPTFDVLLSAPTDDDADATIEHRTKILNGDQLRAELEAPKHGIKDYAATPLHYQALHIWAALTREHLVEDKWPEFRRRLLHYSKVKDQESPDPTQSAADTDSDSPSASTGPESTG